MPSRRQILRASGVISVASLAGCSTLPTFRPKMDFTVSNARSETKWVTVNFIRPRVSERSEAVDFNDSFEIRPEEERRFKDIATDRPYRIELLVGPTRKSHHYHYRPDCADDDPPIGVVVSLNNGGGVTFTQTTCSSNAVFL